jgi:sec-independent protein translocase protein TatC
MDYEEKKMTLWEHLEELRWTLFRMLGTVAFFMACSFFFIDKLIEFFIGPSRPLLVKIGVRLNQSGPFDAFMIKLKTGFLSGFIIALPFSLYFLWQFIAPALNEKEKKGVVWFLFWGTLLFNIGAGLGYFSFPLLISLSAGFSISGVENIWLLSDFLNFVIFWILTCGAIFEMPLLVFILVKVGILTPEILKKSRRYAIVVIFITAAILTPPDAISQLIMAIPLLFLYEISIFFAKFAKPKF